MSKITPAIRRQIVDRLTRDNLYLFLQAAFPVINQGEELQQSEYLEAMCFAFEQVARVPGKRLIVSAPPRHLKSIVGAVLLPAFFIGRDPTKKVMCVSYGSDLAREHGDLFRTLVKHPLYRRLFPDVIWSKKNNRFDHIKTIHGGGRHSKSMNGPLTGFGADLIVLDDMSKPSEIRHEQSRQDAKDAFDKTLYSRLNSKSDGRIVSIQQRLHPDDLTAYLIEKGTFEEMKLPSIAINHESWPLYRSRTYTRSPGEVLNPLRESLEQLDETKRQMTKQAFQAQYQQEPVASESEFLSPTDFQVVETMPDRNNFTWIIQSWDMAYKDGPNCDFSVGLTFGYHLKEQAWYLLDVFRKKLSYNELKAALIHLAQTWKARYILIEEAAMGGVIWQELRRNDNIGRVINVVPTQSKIERFAPHAAKIETGLIRFASDQKWYREFRNELCAFPDSKHDDQVDAYSQFAHYLSSKGKILETTDFTSGRRSVRRRSARSS